MLTVIIPAYNCADKIEPAIRSLDALARRIPLEVVFVDDCSEDQTYELLADTVSTRPAWKLLQLPQNSGSAAAPRNAGVEAASGDYVFFLDADDEVIPEGLAQGFEHAVKYKLDALRASILSVSGAGVENVVDRIPKWDSIKDTTSRLRAIVRYQSLTCSFIMRTELLREHDLHFDINRRIGEDILFTANVLAKSEKIGYRDRPFRKYVKSADGTESVTQKIRDRDFRDFYESWDAVEEALEPTGVSFVKEHGWAALRYALRQYVWFKSEEITLGTFGDFSRFLNRNWATVSEFPIDRRYKEAVDAARDMRYDEFLEATRPRLLVAGHDLKFMRVIEPYLHERFVVRYDRWTGHTTHDESVSEELLQWADYIWVEWLLGAAVWYSRRVASDQRLLVRVHRSEMTADYGLKVEKDRVSRFIAIAPHCLGDFADRFDIPRNKFALIPNPFDVDAYDRVDSDDAVYRIGMVGIVPKLKGFHRAIELISKLREQDTRYQLHIYGRKPDAYPWVLALEDEKEYFESCASAISELGLGNAAFYEGWVDPKSALKNVGFVVSLSDFEGMQVGPTEAFCAGGQGLFLDWRGARMCYPSDFIFETVDDMARYILGMQSGTAFADRARAGEEFVRTRYDVSRVFPELERLFLAVRA